MLFLNPMIRRMASKISPFVAALLVFLVALLLIAPWGEYPVNDDWQYAWIAKVFGETGVFKVDLSVAPALYGQSLMVAPLIRWFGFSHLSLRIFTLVLSVVFLWLFDRILRLGGVGRGLRTLTLAILALNPLFLHFSASFMTEVYGYTLAFLATWLWLRDRSQRQEGALLSWPIALFAGTLIGATFWIRQFCVLVFPALAFATLLAAFLRREYHRIGRTLPQLLAATVLFVTLVLGYFSWAKSTGNYRPAFDGPLSNLLKWSFSGLFGSQTAFWMYMTAFCLPLLILLPWKSFFRRRFWGGYALLFGLQVIGLVFLYLKGKPNSHIWANLHPRAPVLGNVIFDTGIGPITLGDVYQSGYPLRPSWPAWAWWSVHVFLILATPFWWGVVRGFERVREQVVRGADRVRSEVLWFGVTFAIGMGIFVTQGFKGSAFDRYHFPALLGFLIFLPTLLEWLRSVSVEGGERWAGLSVQSAVVALVPLTVFTVFGLHDYFRWNDVRLALFQETVASGVAPTDFDAGYEINGWVIQENRSAIVGRECPENLGWYCSPKAYAISLNPLPGYREVKRVPVSTWLADFPPMLLLKKD